jgi:cell division cycle protein 37
LNQKWEYFQGFPENLKRAMKSESLDEVNKVLERMNLEEAEEIVRKMQEGGMLSFRCVFVDDEEYFPFVAW